MRILHISDFHLDNKDKDQSILYIVEPLINTINEIQKEKPIDLILITGDLVNIGGKNYDEDISLAFLDCEEVLFNPLLKATNLSKDRIYFTPGNHDIVRSADTNRIEKGLQATLTNPEELISFFSEPDGINKGINRILPYKEFERYFYKSVNNCPKITNFQSSYRIEIDGRTVGISCLNSSWRCYDSDKDKNRILIGEKQITNSLKEIDDCEIKIAISHHHFEWLDSFDSEIIEILLKQNYNLYFTGHAHRVKAGYTQEPDGKLFTFCAPGILSNSLRKAPKKYENGFSIVDYNIDEAKLRVTFRKGEYPKKQFVLNTSLGNEGVWEIDIPVGSEIQRILYEQSLLRGIKNESKPKIDSHLLSYATDTDAPKVIDDIFVMPNISSIKELDAEKEDITIEDLNEIIINNHNFILFGTKESGKTILLDKILLNSIETNKEHHQIPVIINFNELHDNVLKEIRSFWNKTTEEATEIVSDYNILLLIDNISFEDNDIFKLKALKRFFVKYPNVRFIGTYQQLFDEDFPINLELVSLLTFEKLTLKQFKAKQIKSLIRKWFPNTDKYDTPKKLETLTNAFLALNLPRTPFAVSMFLWIIEKQENYKPINNSTLIDNFIEKLLKKHDLKEVLRERFGYDNKIWIISHLAYTMLKKENENYSLNYSDFVQVVDKYLKLKKFEDFKTDQIVSDLLNTGIFIHENGDIRFRFTCFFEFFLVKRMETDKEFAEEVLSEEHFLDFVNEIDYFTGLNRGETDLLKQINQRLEKGFSELNGLIEKTRLEREYENADGFFTNRDEKGKEKPSLVSQLNEDKVIEFLPSNKPTEEDLEVIEDKKLELQKAENGIAKKEKGNKIQDLGKLLVLTLKVIKNSEEVWEKDLKLKSYEIALKNSISFAILNKAIFELFLKNQDKLPQSKVEELMSMNQYLPLLYELFLFDNIGTLKLTSVVREKITKDNKSDISEFEKALSVFLYADIRGKGYDKIISDFTKTAKKRFIEDLIFFKLVTYYFYRSKDDEMDSFYLNLIADSIIASKGYNKKQKSEIIVNYRKKKQDKLT